MTMTPLARLIERLVKMRNETDKRLVAACTADMKMRAQALNGEITGLARALRVARRMAREESK